MVAVREVLATVLEDVAGLVDGGGAGVMVEWAFDLCQLGRWWNVRYAALE